VFFLLLKGSTTEADKDPNAGRMRREENTAPNGGVIKGGGEGVLAFTTFAGATTRAKRTKHGLVRGQREISQECLSKD